MPAIELINIKY